MSSAFQIAMKDMGDLITQANLGQVAFDKAIEPVMSQLAEIAPEIITNLAQLETTTKKYVILQRNKTYTTDRQINVSSTIKKFDGNNATITCQFAPIAGVVTSGLLFTNCTDIEISNFKMNYNFAYDDTVEANRSISGMLVNDSTNVDIHHVSTTLFPRAGIEIGWSSNYSENVYIHDVVCNNNRSAGLFYGNVRNIIIDRCVTNYNGIISDFGTGYGSAGVESKQPIGVTIRDCTANYNYRKGIDTHAGEDIFIDHNTVIGNRLYGIFVTSDFDIGKVDIINNTIADMANDGATMPYNTAYAIYAGSRTQGIDQIKTIINISNNDIKNIGKTAAGLAVPIYIEPNGLTSAEIMIHKNHVVGKALTYLVQGTGPATDPGVDYKISIIDNVFIASSVDFFSINMQSGKHLKIQVERNTFDITTYSQFLVITYVENAPSIKIFRENIVNIPAYVSEDLFKLNKNDKEIFENNYLNGVRKRNWDGYKLTYSTIAMPTTENWTKGSIVHNLNPTVIGTAGSRYIVKCWIRLTTGNTHVLNTDWSEERVLTGT